MPGLADLLGLPSDVNTADQNPQIAAPPVDLPQMDQPQAAPQQHHGLLGGGLGGGLRDFLGILGDALLIQSGHAPMYGPAKQQRKIGAALQSYLGNMDPGLAQIFEADPETGLALYKMQHPQAPAGVEGFEYYRHADPQTRSDYEKYLKLIHPSFMSPITLGPNDTYDPGGGDTSGGGEATATGPNGEKIRFNPQSGAWEPMGGQTAPPSGNFP